MCVVSTDTLTQKTRQDTFRPYNKKEVAILANQ